MTTDRVDASEYAMKGPYRDIVTGQYSYINNWERMCVCGHKLGIHCAGGFECDIGNPDTTENRGCPCKKFKPVRKRK